MRVAAIRTHLRVVGLMDTLFPRFHPLNDVGCRRRDVGTPVPCSRKADLWVIGYACEIMADANCGTVTIVDSKLPYPDCPTPPNRPLYALKQTLQNRVWRCRFIAVRNEQQGKMARGLFPRIRELVR